VSRRALSRRPLAATLAFRQPLLQLLEANPRGEDALFSRLEDLRAEGHPVYSSMLAILAHLSFSESEARAHWQGILAHREQLRERLGRDVGLRVALLDYFVNVDEALTNPKVIELAIYERTERSAVTDGLTGLYNHAYLLTALRREMERARRHGLALSLAIFDLDNFKKVNDTSGHLEGDRVLIRAAVVVARALRQIDVAARYGGEEFAVILPDTPRTGAYVVAERIRQGIERHFRRRRGGPTVTVSGGVACFPEDAESVEELIRRADKGLYQSKANGKNRITLAAGERRHAVRLPATLAVRIVDGAERPAAARTANVSADGLLLRLKQPVPLGSVVRATIRPRNAAPLEVVGQVVRVAPLPEAAGRARYEIGVRLQSGKARAARLLALAGGAP
jgi:diguanylate cyclase (GGDEF)-like protein